MSLLFALLAFTTNLGAADLSGAWTLKYEKDFSGHPGSSECTVQQKGEALTGRCGGSAEIVGKVKGQKVTLQHKTGKNNEMTAYYSAALNKERTVMKGTWYYVDSRDRKRRTGEFSLIKH